MKRMDPAEAERFLRERIAEMASHDDPTNDAAAAVLAALDAARAELAEIREAFDAPPYETHASMLTLLREAVRLEDENETLTVQHQGRGELIARVAEAAGHEAQYPGQGLAEHVAALRAEVDQLRAVLRAIADGGCGYGRDDHCDLLSRPEDELCDACRATRALLDHDPVDPARSDDTEGTDG